MARWIFAAGVATSGAMTACATASVDVGYSVPANGDTKYDSWMIEGRAAAGGIVKFGAAARTRLGDEHDQLALAPELTVSMEPGPVVVGVRAGVNLLQMDRHTDEWTFGAGSPYLQPLLQFKLGEPAYIFVGGTLEYDIDTGKGPDQWMVGAQLGVGIDL